MRNSQLLSKFDRDFDEEAQIINEENDLYQANTRAGDRFMKQLSNQNEREVHSNFTSRKSDVNQKSNCIVPLDDMNDFENENFPQINSNIQSKKEKEIFGLYDPSSQSKAQMHVLFPGSIQGISSNRSIQENFEDHGADALLMNDEKREDGDLHLAQDNAGVEGNGEKETLISKDQLQNSNQSISKKEWWPMRVGKTMDQQSDLLQQILDNNDHDVYPMSLQYSPDQRLKIKIIRFTVLFICIYLCVPLDLYIRYENRIGYYGTQLVEQYLDFSEVQGNFSFSLINCQVYLKEHNDQDRMFLEYGFEFNVKHQFNSSMLLINGLPTQNCIVNVYLPINVLLPPLVFNFSGEMDNIVFNDQKANGASFKFSNLTIQGDTCFINLRDHQAHLFKVSLTYSLMYLTSFSATTKVVDIITGLYSEYLGDSQLVNQIEAYQRFGLICLYGPQLRSLNQTQCQFKSEIRKPCQMSALLCKENSAICSDVYQNVQTIKVNLTDGPVQIRYLDEIDPQDKYMTFQGSALKAIEFNTVSNTFLNRSNQNYKLDSEIDRVSVLQTVGVDYQRAWIYTNRKVFIESQFWPLVWGSGTLLRPSMDYNKLVLIDNQCPARKTSQNIDVQVSNYYQNYFPQTSNTLVAFVSGYSQFFEVQENKRGEISIVKLKIERNPLMIVSILIAAIIGVCGSFLMVRLIFLVYKYLYKRYNDWIKAQKSFALTKRQCDLRESKNVAFEESVKFEFETQQNVLEIRGIFSSKYELLQNINTETNYTYKFSLFQIPTLYIDFTLRTHADSIREYIHSIPENQQQFSNVKIKLSQKQDLSITMQEFQNLYSNFCTKMGFTEINVEREGLESLAFYNIHAENQQGQEQLAYSNIRFKTSKEKSSKIITSSQQNVSSIAQFLSEECIQTQFETDFIQFDDMKKAYLRFCYLQGKTESQQEQIIGSQEVVNFGAQVNPVPPPIRLIGVKYENPGTDDKNLIRRPSENKISMIQGLMKMDSIIPNAILSIVHFAIVVLVPAPVPIILYMAFQEMVTLQEDIYAKPLLLSDLYITNRLDPWWNNVPYLDQFLYAHIIVVVFILCALLELVAYNLTGFQNNGRFQVKLTLPKRILKFIVYAFLSLFTVLYFAMFWFVLVWTILAAVMNPNKFLPYAAAAMTFFTTIGIRYVQLKLRYLNVFKNIDRIIEDKINLVVEQSVAKLRRITQQKISMLSLPESNIIFQRELNSYFERIFETTSRTIVESIKDGNISSISNIARIASAGLGGLQSTIIELSVAVISKNKLQMIESLQKLAQDLNVDFNLLESVAEITLNEYDPDQVQQEELLGQAEIQIKKFYRKLVPNTNVDPFGDLLQLTEQGNTLPLISYLEDLRRKCPNEDFQREIFKVFIYTQQESIDQMKVELSNFINNISNLQEQEQKNIGLQKFQYQTITTAFEVFKILQNLSDGDFECFMKDLNCLDGVNNSAKKICFDYNFPILFLSAFRRAKSTFTTQVINQGFKEILNINNMVTAQQEEVKHTYLSQDQTQTKSEKMFLAFYIMLKGETMDLDGLSDQIRKVQPSFLGDIFKIMHLCSTNSLQSFKSIVYSLDCASNMDLLMEFYQIINQSKIDPYHICSKIGLSINKGRILLALINLMYMIIKYEIILKKKTDDQGKEKKQQTNQKYRAEFSLIRRKIYESVSILDDKADLDISTLHNCRLLLEWLAAQKQVQSQSQNRNQSNLDIQSEVSSVHSNTEQSQNGDKQDIDIDEADDETDEEAYDEALKQGKWKKLIRYIFNGTLSCKLQPKPEEDKKQDQPCRVTHKSFFKEILFDDKLKKNQFNDKVMTVIQCLSIIMIRNDLLINQFNKNYNKCVRRLAEIFDIEQEKLDFMIDLISGNPLDVFKVSSKQPYYKITDDGKFEIRARFDPQRQFLLEDILQADRVTQQYACVLWHHYYRFFKQGKFTIPFMMKICVIKQEFFELMQIIRLNQSQKHSDFSKIYIQQRIRKFLVKGIQQSKIISKQQKEANDQLIYPKYFVEERNGIKFSQNVAQDKFIIPSKQDQYTIQPFEKEQIIIVIEQLLRIKTCKLDAIQYIFKLQPRDERLKIKEKKIYHNDVILLQSILIGVQNETTVDSILNFLYFASKQIPLFKKPGLADNDIDWKDEKLYIQKEERNMFVQLAIILSSAQFQNLANSKQNDKKLMAQSLQKITKLFNKAHNFSKKNNNAMEPIEEENYDKILGTLFQSNYFSDIAFKMFEFLGDQKLFQKQCNAILGLLLGASIQDLSIIRFSVITMLEGHVINLQMLDGLAAALVNDITTDSKLKFMCKTLDLNAQYLIDMIDFVEKRPQNLSSILFNILKGLPAENIKECASLIHLMKGEISMCKAIAERINVEPKKMMPVLSAATGNLNIMGEFYESLSQTLNLNSLTTVQYISELAQGKTQCIYKLSEIKTNRFTIFDPELVEALFRINFYGKQVQERAIEEYSEINSLENSLLVLSRKLSQVLQYPNEEAQKMNKFFITIVKACWNDPLAINQIIRTLHSIKDHNSFWCSQHYNKNVRLRQLGHDGEIELIKRMLRKIVDEYKVVFNKIDEKCKFFIKLVQKNVLKKLSELYQEQSKGKNVQTKDLLNLSQNNQQLPQVERKFDRKLLEDAEKVYQLHKMGSSLDLVLSAIQRNKKSTSLVSLKVGCTFGASLYNSYAQPFYYCLTCNDEILDESRVICVVCALHCHKGHKLQVGAYGIEQKIFCDCGGGSFTNCSQINRNNPIMEELKILDQADIKKTNEWKEMQSLEFQRQNLQQEMIEKQYNQKIEEIAGRNKRCRMLLKSFEAFQEKVIDEKYEKDKNNKYKQRHSKDKLFIHENDDNYMPQEFIADLAKAYNLPDYFIFQDDDTNKEKNETFNFLRKLHLISEQKVNQIPRQALTSKLSNLQFTLVENIILMALGYMTTSFQTIFSAKEKYDIHEFQNQQIYKKGKASNSESVYRTMSLFTALAKVNFQKIIEYGDTICDALGESGNREVSAMEKICNVLMLSKGGKLPKKSKDTRARKNHYFLLFKKIFGNKAEEMMVLNKLLQMPPKEVVNVLGLDQTKQNIDANTQNIKEWVDSVIFTKILRLNKNSLEYFKNIIGFSCANRQCFDYVVKELGIPIQKAQMYKALLTSDEKQLVPIYVNLKMMIPISFNQFMLKVWKGDRDAITNFILKFFEVNNSIYKEWKTVKFNYTDLRDPKMKYLCHIYDLMSGDAVDLKKSYEYVITTLLAKDINILVPTYDSVNKTYIQPPPPPPYMKRLMHCFTCIDAIFCNSVIDVPEIAYSLDMISLPKTQRQKQSAYDKDKIELLKSVVDIVNKTWSDKDLKIVVKALVNGDYEDQKVKKEIQKLAIDHQRPDVFEYYRAALQAMDGDLIALAKIDDELLNPKSETHIHSLLASLMTGQTKFDIKKSKTDKTQQKNVANSSQFEEVKIAENILNENSVNLQEEPDIQDQDNSRPQSMNLLVREIYQIYEKIINSEYSSLDKNVTKFLEWSYNQKVPLYLLMVFSEQKLLIDKLFDIGKELSVSLTQGQQLIQQIDLNQTKDIRKIKNKVEQKRLIDSFVKFIDPFNQNTHMKTLMKQIVETKQLMMPILKISNSPLFAEIGDKIGLSKMTLQNQDPRSQKIYGYLKEELNISNSDQTSKQEYIQLDLIAFTKLLANCYLMDTHAIKHLYLIFVELYDNNLVLQNILTLIYKLLNKDKNAIFENLPAVVALITKLPRQYEEEKDQEVDNFDDNSRYIDDYMEDEINIDDQIVNEEQIDIEKQYDIDNKNEKENKDDTESQRPTLSIDLTKIYISKKLQLYQPIQEIEPESPSKLNNNPEKEAQTIVLISKWMQSIAVMLDKHDVYKINQRRKIITDSIQSLQPLQDEDSQVTSILVKANKEQTYLIDIVMGLISLCKMEFDEMKPLALKVGGFPDPQKLNDFFFIINKNKDIIGNDSSSQSLIPQAQQEGMLMSEQDELSIEGMNPRQIFNYFSRKNQGKIGIEEFSELCKYMGLNLPNSTRMMIFSKVDLDKTGDLELTEFLKVLYELKQVIILQSIEGMGLTINDLVSSLVMSISILLMTFVFIFISIQAFSTTSTFSSVTNSILPVIAGGAVNRSAQNQSTEGDKELTEVVDKKMK